MADYTKADLGPAIHALLDYCVAITRNPRSGSLAAVEKLRRAGWEDEAIHDAVQVTGFFNYYDRLADGLGVEPEPSWTPSTDATRSSGQAVERSHDEEQAEADDRR